MAKLSLKSESDPEPKLPPTMQYEGGNIKIALTPDPSEDLLLHGEILLENSAFFQGSKASWTGNNAMVVKRPATTEERKEDSNEHHKNMPVVTYYLVLTESDIFMLETKPPTDRNALTADGARPVYVLYQSDFAQGFLGRETDPVRDAKVYEVPKVRCIHRILFGLVYKEDVDLGQLNYTDIANLVALAELYTLLHFIAPAVREHLLSLPDLWEDVRNEYQFHFALSIKLRCESVFYDALRHIIGAGNSLSILVKELDLEPSLVFSIQYKRDDLKKAESQLLSRLQCMTMAEYIPHAGRGKELNGVEYTTHDASRMKLSLQENIVKCAHLIVLETFTLHLCGDTHWSHVREYGAFPSGVFSQSSLRNWCNAVNQAVQTKTELELFAPVTVSNIKLPEDTTPEQAEYAVLGVKSEIKKVVSQMAYASLPYIAAPDFKPTEVCYGADEPQHDHDHHNEDYAPRAFFTSRGRGRGCRGGRGRGRGRGRLPSRNDRWIGGETHTVKTTKREFERVGMTANNDTECHYFTCVDFGDEDFHPWEEDFVGYKLEDVKEVSKDWAELVGLGIDELNTPPVDLSAGW